MPGEAVWPVPPLAVPAAAGEEADTEVPDPDGAEELGRYDAVRLFVERAATADPSFTLTPANAAVVAELCRRLDGLPLAIELAAARVRALPLAEIAVRLDDRFRLLAGGGRTMDPRQQTLRATIDWSWELLEEPDRRLLRRLAVFSGGWTVAAAEHVCGRRRPGSRRCPGRAVPVGGSVVGGGGGWGAGPVPVAGVVAGLCGRAAGGGGGDRGGGGPPHRLVPRPGRTGGRPSDGAAVAADARRRLRQPAGGAGPGGGRARPRHRPAAGRGAQVVLVDRPHRRGPSAAARGARAGRRAAADARSWPGRSRERRCSRCR